MIGVDIRVNQASRSIRVSPVFQFLAFGKVFSYGEFERLRPLSQFN